jgi:murein DD-endopeptidase MepM/ murein hydrolase activator NlpD
MKELINKIVAETVIADKVTSDKVVTDSLQVAHPKKEFFMIYVTFGIYLLTVVIMILYVNFRPGIVSMGDDVRIIKSNQDSLKIGMTSTLLAVQSLTNIVNKQQDIITHSPIGKPLDIQNMKNVVSKFGPRLNSKGEIEYHKAIDVSAPKGSPLYAMASGIVIESQYDDGWGNTVVVDCGNKYSYRISHMDQLIVQKGQEVIQGEQVGTVGNTGHSNGNHADIRVMYKSEGKTVNVDPAIFL